ALSEAAVIAAIRDGHVIVMRDAKTPPPAVGAGCGAQTAQVGDTLHCPPGSSITVSVETTDLHGVRSTLVVNWAPQPEQAVVAGRPTFRISATDGYLRVHLLDRRGATVAVTNPVYVVAH